MTSWNSYNARKHREGFECICDRVAVLISQDATPRRLMFCAGSFISPAPRKDRPGLSWFQMKLWIGKITSRKWILAVSQVHSGSSTDLTSEIVFDVRIQIYLNDHVQFSPLVETIHSERCRSVPDSGNTKFTERRFASNNSLRGTNSEGTNCHNKAKFKIRSSRLSSRRV